MWQGGGGERTPRRTGEQEWPLKGRWSEGGRERPEEVQKTISERGKSKRRGPREVLKGKEVLHSCNSLYFETRRNIFNAFFFFFNLKF